MCNDTARTCDKWLVAHTHTQTHTHTHHTQIQTHIPVFLSEDLCLLEKNTNGNWRELNFC